MHRGDAWIHRLGKGLHCLDKSVSELRCHRGPHMPQSVTQREMHRVAITVVGDGELEWHSRLADAYRRQRDVAVGDRRRLVGDHDVEIGVRIEGPRWRQAFFDLFERDLRVRESLCDHFATL